MRKFNLVSDTVAGSAKKVNKRIITEKNIKDLFFFPFGLRIIKESKEENFRPHSMALTLIELKDYVEMETPGEFQHAIIK
jgi:hypothetical protein